MFKTICEAAAGDNKLRARIYRLVRKGVLEHKVDSGTLKINYKQLLELVAQEAKESSSAVYGMTCAVRNERASMPAETPALPSAPPPGTPEPPSVPAAPSPEIIALLHAMNQLTERVGMLQTKLERLVPAVPETRPRWLYRVLAKVGFFRRQ